MINRSIVLVPEVVVAHLKSMQDIFGEEAVWQMHERGKIVIDLVNKLATFQDGEMVRGIGDTQMQATIEMSDFICNHPNEDPRLMDELERVTEWQKKHQPNESEFFDEIIDSLAPITMPVMPVVAAIPVSVQESPQTLLHCLGQYAKQDTGAFEIFILLNGYAPTIDMERDITCRHKLEQLEDALEEARQRYPQLKIRSTTVTYDREPPTIGDVRKTLWGMVMYDTLSRGPMTDDVLVISNDVDTLSLPPNYISSLLDSAQQPSRVDMVAGRLLWDCPAGFQRGSTAAKILRYWSYLDHVYDSNVPVPQTSDANTSIWLSTYAAAGGFNTNAETGEMYDLKERISDMRWGSDHQVVRYDPRARMTTSSRRLIMTMALGHSPWHAWNTRVVAFSHDDALRTDKLEYDVAAANAERYGAAWISEAERLYIDQHVTDPAKAHRLRNNGRKVLGLEMAVPY